MGDEPGGRGLRRGGMPSHKPIIAAHVCMLLAHLRAQGVAPVLRTYNTVMIACNACNQPGEALAAYGRLLADGLVPNATTFNALMWVRVREGVWGPWWGPCGCRSMSVFLLVWCGEGVEEGEAVGISP